MMLSRNRVLSVIILIFIGFISICQIYLPAIVALVSVMICLVSLILLFPLFGLYLSVLTIPFRNVMLVMDSPVRKESMEMIALFPFVIFIVFISCFINKLVKPKAIMSSFLFFVGWATISLFYTSDLLHGVNEYVRLISSFLILIVFGSLIIKKEVIVKILYIIPFLSIILFLFVITSMWVNGQYNIKLLGDMYLRFELLYMMKRPSGFASAGVAGNIMSVFVFLNIALLPVVKKPARYLIFGIIMLLVIGTALTASKAAFGTLIIGLFLVLLFTPQLRKNMLRWIGAVSFFLTIVFGTIYIVASELVLFKRLSLSVSSEDTTTFTDRLSWWKTGFKSVIEDYGVGSGIGGFVRLIDPFPTAHSFYFSVLFDLGIVGLVMFLYIILRFLYNFFKTIRICRDGQIRFILICLLTSFIMTLIYGLIDEEYTYVFLWFIAAVGLGIRNMVYEDDALGKTPVPIAADK